MARRLHDTLQNDELVQKIQLNHFANLDGIPAVCDKDFIIKHVCIKCEKCADVLKVVLGVDTCVIFCAPCLNEVRLSKIFVDVSKCLVCGHRFDQHNGILARAKFTTKDGEIVCGACKKLLLSSHNDTIIISNHDSHTRIEKRYKDDGGKEKRHKDDEGKENKGEERKESKEKRHKGEE